MITISEEKLFNLMVDMYMNASKYPNPHVAMNAATKEIQKVKNCLIGDVVKSFFEPIDELPENRPLYKDSGLWQIRTDDMEEVLYQQEVNETFDEFIKRCHSKESIWTDADI